MSLVEKALSKMKDAAERKPAAAEVVPLPPPAPADVAPPDRAQPDARAVAAEATPATPRSVPPRGTAHEQLLLSLETLREKGYLPEREQEREFSEQYRHIKRPLVSRAVTLRGSGAVRNPAVIMVTSALPGEGKTFTAINLARSLAREQDVSVLLVDADVANPRTTQVFEAGHRRGLIDALKDDTVDPESLVVDTDLGMQFLPAGSDTDLGAELFGSKRLAVVLTRLMEAAPDRIVLLDTAPILITNEGKSLAPLPGQVVLVVKANSTPQQAVLEVLQNFDEEQYVGVVLNESDEASGDGYYYGSYEYGRYGYGNRSKGQDAG